MTNEEAKSLVEETFTAIMHAENNDQLAEIITDPIFNGFRPRDTHFPRPPALGPESIQQLIEDGILAADNEFVGLPENPSALERLFYAILWKNGDLKKIPSLIRGVVSDNDVLPGDAVVFYQFGRHLRDPANEPIIDQHVIRAWGIHLANLQNSEDLSKLRRLETIPRYRYHLIQSYKEWLLLTDRDLHHGNCLNYLYLVDQVLITVGKKVKRRRGQDIDENAN